MVKRGWLVQTVLGLVLALAPAPPLAAAVPVSGQAGLTLYEYQSHPADTILSLTPPGTTHVVSSQFLSLDIREFSLPGLSLYASARNTTPLAPSDSTRSLFRLYGVYLHYQLPSTRVAIRVGRQFLTAGMANGIIDGIRVSQGFGPRVLATGFVGLESHYDSLRISSWRDGGTFGGEILLRPSSGASFSLSAWQANRDGVVAKRRIGGDLYSRIHSQTDLTGHLEVDLLQPALHRAVLRAETHPLSRVSVNARVEHRQPVFAKDSFFNKLEPSPTEEVGGGVQVALGSNLDLAGQGTHVFFEGGHADRVSFAVRSNLGTLTLLRRTGLTNRSWQLTASSEGRLGNRLTLGGSLDYNRYDRRDDPVTHDYTVTAIARLGLQVFNGLNLSADIENLINPDYVRDTRLLVRATYDF